MKLVFTLLWFVSAVCVAQKGHIFPTLIGRTLEDQMIQVPFNNGKFTVVAIAFHRGAEDELKKWLNPLFDAFIKTEKKSNSEIDLADVFDVNFIFIPMISGFRKIADDFKRKTDKQFWAYIMDTEKTDISELQKQLGVNDNKRPYFYVLDSKGVIRAEETGAFNQTKLDKLEDTVE